MSGKTLSALQVSRPALSKDAAKVRIEAAATVSREAVGPFTQSDAERLAGVLERRGFEGTKVVLAPARGTTSVQPLELPPRSSGAPLAQIARAEMARVQKLDPGAIEVATWDVPPPVRAGKSTHVMAASLTKRASNGCAGLLESVGLELIAIDVRSLAMARAARAWLEPTGVCMLIDVTWEGVSIIVVLGSRVVFERDIEHATPAKMCNTAAERWRLDEETLAMALQHPDMPHASEITRLASGAQSDFVDAIVPEVSRSAAYASHRYPSVKLERLLLCGEWAGVTGLRERLEAHLHVPARVLRAVDAMALGGGAAAADAGPGALLALGLAMHPGHALTPSEVAA
ncbi:MAG: pilus assembly protein PilM [Phycisphaerales bacterium]